MHIAYNINQNRSISKPIWKTILPFTIWIDQHPPTRYRCLIREEGGTRGLCKRPRNRKRTCSLLEHIVSTSMIWRILCPIKLEKKKKKKKEKVNRFETDLKKIRIKKTAVVIFSSNREDLCVDEVQDFGLSRKFSNILTQC